MPKKDRNFEKIISRTKIYLVVIAILLILLCISNIWYIIPAVVLYTGIIIYSLWTNSKGINAISQHIQDVTVNVDSTVKNALVSSPFPLIILETDGNIIWKSSKFVSEFSSVDIKAIVENLAKNIKLEILQNKLNKNNNNKSIQQEITVGKKTYKVLGEYVKSKKKKSNEFMMMLYFLDNTDYLNSLKELEEEKSCIGIIMLDNYEETVQVLPDDKKSLILAEIEKKIYDWVAKFEGLVIKSDRNTYVYFVKNKYLQDIKENKFEILDIVKEIDTEETVNLTISSALSTEGASYYDKYKSVQNAMEIVLGRGGDQAVIRENETYKFFGGRTLEVEKRTKVKARTVARALEELIKESKDVFIMGHTNPDIDSMGSCLGIYRLAKSIGKKAYIINENSDNAIANFMEYLEKEDEYKDVIIKKNDALNTISDESILVILDTHKKTYVEVPEILDKTNKIVIIDHHRKSPDFIDNVILAFHEVYASSAAELVTEILQYVESKVELNSVEVEALYAGIMVDTKNFTFKTGVRTFEAAAYLRKKGVDILKVKKWFQSNLEDYNMIADIVKNAEIINESIAISEYSGAEKNVNLICAKAADELLTISNITASFVLGKMNNKICVSGRSIGDINVQVILEKLGGGGHITVAGAQIEGMNMEEARQELINRINEYFTEV